MEDNKDVTPTQVREIENGIFNMVITLVRVINTNNDLQKSKDYVATYLERIANGLRSEGEQQENDQ